MNKKKEILILIMAILASIAAWWNYTSILSIGLAIGVVVLVWSTVFEELEKLFGKNK